MHAVSRRLEFVKEVAFRMERGLVARRLPELEQIA
jgi:hypothetical protein